MTIFPGEKREAYYKPAATRNGVVHELADGKLYDHYNFFIAERKKEGT